MIQSEQNGVYKKSSIVMGIITLVLLTGVFICVLCNFLIDRTVSWALYPAGSCALAWLILLPLLLAKRRRIVLSLTALTVFILPFLRLIEYLSPSRDWLLPLAVPIVIVSLAWLWITVIGLLRCHKQYLYVIGLAVLLSLPVYTAIHLFAARFLNEPFDAGQLAIYLPASLTVSALLFLAGYIKKYKEKNADMQTDLQPVKTCNEKEK